MNTRSWQPLLWPDYVLKMLKSQEEQHEMQLYICGPNIRVKKKLHLKW